MVKLRKKKTYSNQYNTESSENIFDDPEGVHVEANTSAEVKMTKQDFAVQSDQAPTSGASSISAASKSVTTENNCSEERRPNSLSLVKKEAKHSLKKSKSQTLRRSQSRKEKLEKERVKIAAENPNKDDTHLNAAPAPDYASKKTLRRSKSGDVSHKTRENHPVRYLGGFPSFEKKSTFIQYQQEGQELVKQLKQTTKTQTKFRELIISTPKDKPVITFCEDLSDHKTKILVSGDVFIEINIANIVACSSFQQNVVYYLKEMDQETHNSCLIFMAANAPGASSITSHMNFVISQFAKKQKEPTV